MEPTDAGKLLLERAGEILDLAGRTEKEMKNYGHSHASLRIGVAPVNATIVFPRLFELMREQYPQIRLEMVEAGSGKSLVLLKEDQVDACILSGKGKVPAGFCSYRMASLSLALYTWEGNPLAEKEQVAFTDLDGQALALLDDDTFLTAFLTKQFQEKHIEPQVAVKTNQLAAIGQLIRKKIASSVLFQGAFEEDSSLVYRPLEDMKPVPVQLVWKDSAYLPYTVSCLSRAVKGGI